MIWLSLRNNLKKNLSTLMKPSPPNRRDWTCDRGDLDFQSQERYTISISIHHHLKVGYRIPEGDEWREYQIQETRNMPVTNTSVHKWCLTLKAWDTPKITSSRSGSFYTIILYVAPVWEEVLACVGYRMKVNMTYCLVGWTGLSGRSRVRRRVLLQNGVCTRKRKSIYLKMVQNTESEKAGVSGSTVASSMTWRN